MLGASPVVLPGGEVYSALEKGVVDGAAWPASGVLGMRWYEVAKYMLRPSFGLSHYLFLMNLNAWNRLTDAERNILLAEGRKAEETWFKEYDRMVQEEEAELIKRGMQITEMGAAQKSQAAAGLGAGAMGPGGEEKRSGGQGPARAAQAPGADRLGPHRRSSGHGGPAMHPLWRKLADLHDAVTSASFAAAAAVLAAIAFSFCYEVTARYFFAAPTSWANAFVSYLLCAAIFLAVPELTRRRAHVAINLLLDRLPSKSAVVLNRVIRAGGAAACLLATWITANATFDQISLGIDTISTYPIPKWWVSIFIPYGMLSSGLYFLRDLLERRCGRRHGEPDAMTWWIALSSGIGLLLGLLFLGIPVFVAFLILNVTGILVLMGPAGFGLFANSIYTTATTTALATVPLFIVMGEILFRSGAMEAVFDSLDRLVGRIRGRQYILCILLSAILGALSGAAMAVAGLLGRSLFPEMRRRGYNTRLSAGTILAGACLDPIIPPSVLAILIATLAEISTASPADRRHHSRPAADVPVSHLCDVPGVARSIARARCDGGHG